MVCGGKRRGRAALRRTPHVRVRNGNIEVIAGQDEVYEQTLPRGPYKKPRKYKEANFQVQVNQFLAKALPEGFFYTCFPSGRHLGAFAGKRLKDEGLRPGMPDMVVFGNHWGWESSHTLWLELKAKSGSLSQAQKDVHKQLLKLGHQVVTVKTLEQVQDALAEFCFPEKLRARVA